MPLVVPPAAAELARLLDAAASPLPQEQVDGASDRPTEGSPAALARLALRVQAAAPALAAVSHPGPRFRGALRDRLLAVAAEAPRE